MSTHTIRLAHTKPPMTVSDLRKCGKIKARQGVPARTTLTLTTSLDISEV